jgi:LPS export ABC transporter protein LptC
MARWQRSVRVVFAVCAVVFTVVVVLALRRRTPAPPPTPVVRTDPAAVIETTGGRFERFRLSREDVRIEYEKQLTYADGSNRMIGVRVTTQERGGDRTFTMTGREGQITKGESVITLNGDVKLAVSDGMTATAGSATYADSDGIVRAPGAVRFTRGRFSGTGVGMTFDNRANVMTILDQSIVHVAPEGASAAADVSSGSAVFDRGQKQLRFDQNVRVQRDDQTIESSRAVAYLNDDETKMERLELRDSAKISKNKPAAGALKQVGGHDIDLTYRDDGETLEHMRVLGNAALELAGMDGQMGRQIAANTIDVALAADGATPESLTGQDAAQLTLPAEAGVPARVIKAASVRATGMDGQGLSDAAFSGSVQYRERGANLDRTATADTLDVAMKPGMSALEEARFTHTVRFLDGKMSAAAAAARYDIDKGVLQLSGSEKGSAVPHVVNDQIVIDAAAIDVTLVGPKMKASGDVKSVIRPAKNETKLPSMLKQDQPVNVTASTLDYDGTVSKASYKGKAQLWQADTTIKADAIALDDRTGDLSAQGSVSTATVLEEVKEKKTERMRSIGTSSTFNYQDADHRATYTGNAHLSGPEGDLTAAKIELYLKPSGNELDRAEGYEAVTLRDQRRKTSGARLTYTTADERYFVTGAPVTVIDECGRETTGKTLTYIKNAETMTVDGAEQNRTHTKGGGACP